MGRLFRNAGEKEQHPVQMGERSRIGAFFAPLMASIQIVFWGIVLLIALAVVVGVIVSTAAG